MNIRNAKFIRKYASEQSFADETIFKLGGNTEVSELLGISLAAVSYWRKKGIPKLRVLQLHLLKPDLVANPNGVK